MLSELRPIIQRLMAADRSFQEEKGVGFLLKGIPVLLALVALNFALDVFFHFGAVTRLAIVGGLGLFIFAVVACGIFIAALKQNRLERVARRLEARDPKLGSKLINALQLQEQTEDPQLQPLTRDMAKSAVGGYAEDLADVDFQPLARTGRLRIDFKRAALALLLFLILLGAFYKISLTEVVRFADPFGDHPPYSLTQLTIVEPGPDGTNVIYNKSFVVRADYSGHQPGDVFLSFHPPGVPDQTVTLPMFNKGEAGFYQQVDRVQSDLVVYVHTKAGGSRSQRRDIHVTLTPQLEQAHVRISAPAYTGIEPREKPFQFKNIKALAGSKVRFRLQSNRPLGNGSIELITPGAESRLIPMAPTAENEVAGELEAAESGRLLFRLVDVDGIASQDSWESSLTVTHDLTPEVRVAEPGKDSFVSMDFKIDAHIEADDDYGIRTLRIHRALNDVFSPPKIITVDGTERHLEQVIPFEFADLGVASGDVISFFAEAIDTAPESNLARSQTIRLVVITEEEYNQFLRQQTDIEDIQGKYSDLFSRFQELINEQEQIGEAVEKLQERLAEASGSEREAIQSELDKLLARQSELNSKLNKMADEMDRFVRDTPLYDFEKELQRSLGEQANTIRQSTSTNNSETAAVAEQSLASSGEPRLTPEMLEAFKQASDDQLNRLQPMQEQTRSEVMETLEDLATLQELMKDFNRFKALYETQESLTSQAKPYDRPGALEREDQLALKDLAATERQVGMELDALRKLLEEHAAAAEERFPKAAQSARDLAEAIDSDRMPWLADKATGRMLAASGDESFQLADRLREEMEKQFSKCQSQGQPQMSGELDSYLTLNRSMKPGNSFQQMLESQKFGPNMGTGITGGMGTGQMGQSGYAVLSAPTMDVLGNESFIANSSATRWKTAAPGVGDETGEEVAGVVLDDPDIVKNLNPVRRESEAVVSEAVLQEYNDLVNEYFKSITK